MQETGTIIEEYDDAILIKKAEGPLNRCNIKTMVYPGFPTDMQPQMVSLLALAGGTSIITENIFDNRFKYAEELIRMGADIVVDGKIAVVEGVRSLTGACVKACDLRAGAALVIAALGAKGTTEIEEIYHIERGYENFVDKLRALGADIEKVGDDDEDIDDLQSMG